MFVQNFSDKTADIRGVKLEGEILYGGSLDGRDGKPGNLMEYLEAYGSRVIKRKIKEV